jgi:chemotaxis signal transduction protein
MTRSSEVEARVDVQALAFSVSGRRCLLPLDGLRQVQALRELTPVPLAPASLLGLHPWRGRMLPVLDLAALLALPPATPQRLLVLGQRDGVLALAVDDIQGLQPVTLAAPPEGVRSDLVRAVTPDGQLLLDGPRLLARHRHPAERSPRP